MLAHRIGATIAALAAAALPFIATSAASAVTPSHADTRTVTFRTQVAKADKKLGSHANSVRTTKVTTSGVDWLSGVSGTVSTFDKWLGNDVGLYSLWPGDETWANMTNLNWLPTPSYFNGQIAIGQAMLPLESDANFADCAAGDYDGYFKTIGSQLDAVNRANAYIRLGWEANGNWYKWSMGNTTPATWIACWRNEVTALRSTDPAAQIIWNENASSAWGTAGHELSYYPGDRYVDVIGVDYYDAWPAMTTRASWNARYHQTESDGAPEGIGAWLKFAEAHHMKLAVPEWGVTTTDGGGGDDPNYVDFMYHFFRHHAAHIAYEAYFDEEQGYQLSWNTPMPRAAATYRSLWDHKAKTTTITKVARHSWKADPIVKHQS